MKLVFLIVSVILTWVLLKSVYGASSEMTIRGGKVTIRSGYVDFGTQQKDVVIISTRTGQCIGILCGVTYPQ